LYPFFEDIRLDIDAIRSQLEERNVPERLYTNALHSFVALATGQYFHTDWAGLHRGTLSEPLCLTFEWCAFLLPDTEEAINEAEIASIATTLDELEASLEGAELPPNLARFLRKLVTRMRQATRRYYTSGARAFVAAQADVVKEIMTSPGLQNEVQVASQNPATKSLLTKSLDVLKAAAEVGGAIDKAGAGVMKVKQVGEFISNLLS
jgi:hypothetical protein